MEKDSFSKIEQLIEVKLATQEDWKTCKDLRLEAITGEDAEMFPLTPEEMETEKNKTEQEWRKESLSDEMFSVLAWNGSEPIGLGRVKEEEKGIWRMRNGYVKKEFRNKGIAQKMFVARLNEIIKRGGTKVKIGIKPGNDVSIHIAEKFGFKRVADENGFIAMELDLSKQEKLNIKIEIATPKDWEDCKKIVLEGITGNDAQMFGLTQEKIENVKERTREIWRDFLEEDENEFVLLCRDNSETIGIITAKKENQEWYVGSLYIKENFRRKGIGAKLFATCLNEIRNRGAEKITLGIKANNFKSINLVSSFHFKRLEDSSEAWFYMLLDNVNDPEVIKKINEVLNAR